MTYIPLHCHSAFSFHAGVCTIPQLVSRAKAAGFPALALTDTDRMSGLLLFYKECRKQNIKPILGAELTDPGRANTSLTVLARNTEGYAQLCEVITERHVNQRTFSFEKVFSKPRPDFFVFSDHPAVLEVLARTPNRERLYGELVNNSPESRLRSYAVAETARQLKLPLLASNNSFFLDKRDWETHRVLRAIGLNATLSRLKPDETAPPHAFFRNAEEIWRLFPNHREALLNTRKIADACTVPDIATGEWILPEISVPAGETPGTWLEKQALEGLQKNYAGTPAWEKAREIQEMELKVIRKLRYPSYFLMVKQIRDWANELFRTRYREPRDCTILRGSAANAITFYNIGVSDLDPVRYNLYFQRFLNEDRASPPDADLDFGWDEREQVFDYITEKWGEDRVAVTCTTNHFRFRAAFRETAKVFGYSEEQITEMFKQNRKQLGAHGKKEGFPAPDTELCMILSRAKKITGKPRFLGQHPGGVLVTNDPIRRHVACEYSGGPRNRLITQIDMHNGIDDLGLIKFDILGNGSLSVLRDTLGQLEEQHLPDPEVNDLEKCYADPAVREILRKGRTRGIFYIESPAQMRLNMKARAETFEEITATSSLVRPAGAVYTRTFVERHRKAKQNIKDWKFVHPSLESILGDTHDVCAFQEDVTKICHQIAGLTYKEADKVRKMMNSLHEGLLDTEEWEQTSRAFINGCMGNKGLTEAQAVELWERVSSFSGFSFCKSHSASYAQLSFRCAYLKTRYPAQFLAAVISNNHGFYTRDVYLDEARRWGVRILPMDVNASEIKYRGKHNWMRPGLMHIRGISRKSLENLTAERRKNGRYRNLTDFIRRTGTRKSEIESLIKTGAFDGFGLSQPEHFALLDGVYGRIRPEVPDMFANSVTLRGQELHPGLGDYTLTEKCLNELHLLGFMLSGNILDILSLHPSAKNTVPAAEIGRYAGRHVRVFGWPITSRTHWIAKSGRLMKFLTIQDATECLDVLFWPRVYERYEDILHRPGPYEIEGRVAEDWGTFTLEADRIRDVDWSPAQIDFGRAEQRLRKSFTGNYIYGNIQTAAAA